MLYHTFIDILKFVCKELKPKEILEWGPGKSTEIMIDFCPEVKILSIEHNKKYYDKLKEKVNPNKVNLKHIPRPNQDTGNGFGYVCFPLREAIRKKQEFKRYDLIFIDGRSRCDCLTIAYLMIKDDGVVILHDSQRAHYQEGLSLFPFVFKDKNKDQTAIMSKTKLEKINIRSFYDN